MKKKHKKCGLCPQRNVCQNDCESCTFAKEFTRLEKAKERAIKRTYKKQIQRTLYEILCGFYYADFNQVGNINKMTAMEYADKANEYFTKIERQYSLGDREGEHEV